MSRSLRGLWSQESLARDTLECPVTAVNFMVLYCDNLKKLKELFAMVGAQCAQVTDVCGSNAQSVMDVCCERSRATPMRCGVLRTARTGQRAHPAQPIAAHMGVALA